MHFRHERFKPMQLQHLSLRFIHELSGTGPGTIGRILRVGWRGRTLGFAGLVLRARQRSARQARRLLRQVERAMAASCPPGFSPRCSSELPASADGDGHVAERLPQS
jgi:hypothetical protein